MLLCHHLRCGGAVVVVPRVTLFSTTLYAVFSPHTASVSHQTALKDGEAAASARAHSRSVVIKLDNLNFQPGVGGEAEQMPTSDSRREINVRSSSPYCSPVRGPGIRF